MKRVLIIGFGRMGITHLAHIRGFLAGRCEFHIYDPSFVFRFSSYFRGIRRNLRFLRALPNSGRYDLVVITSPPSAHASNFDSTFDLSDNFFLEKPLRLQKHQIEQARATGKRLTCGYVLRHNPCVTYMLQKISDNPADHISVAVASNLGKHPGEDWRYDLSKGGGCINELGSHALNLGLHLATNSGQEVSNLTVHSLTTSHFDICIGEPSLAISGDWEQDVRKTTYTVSLESSSYKLTSDLQSVSGHLHGKQVEWSPREQELKVGYYLRGVDFALQTSALLSGSVDDKGLYDAHLTDLFLDETISNA